MKSTKALAINSCLIIIATSLLGIILHELAHYVVAFIFDLKPELHHNYVNHTDGTPQQDMLTAAAGPVFSLVFGVIILWISIKFYKPTLTQLFMIWLAMGNILTFMGYLLIAPIVSRGDTGKVFAYFGIPIWLSILIAIGSFVYINTLFKKMAKHFVHYKNDEVFDRNENARQMLIYPIICSIIVMSLLNLPVITFVSLMPTICMPFTYFATFGGYKRLKIDDAPIVINQVSVVLVVITLALIGVFRLLV